jgi:hypothetical protein
MYLGNGKSELVPKLWLFLWYLMRVVSRWYLKRSVSTHCQCPAYGPRFDFSV